MSRPSKHFQTSILDKFLDSLPLDLPLPTELRDLRFLSNEFRARSLNGHEIGIGRLLMLATPVPGLRSDPAAAIASHCIFTKSHVFIFVHSFF